MFTAGADYIGTDVAWKPLALRSHALQPRLVIVSSTGVRSVDHDQRNDFLRRLHSIVRGSSWIMFYCILISKAFKV